MHFLEMVVKFIICDVKNKNATKTAEGKIMLTPKNSLNAFFQKLAKGDFCDN